MAFRRQDIPKTTRAGEHGEPRRLFPRFIRDDALIPKIDLAIGYLDGMVGRKRGDLSPDVVLELFGDPKLARCILTCLADAYRYRTPDFAEVIGEDRARALAGWDLFSPGDLRDVVFRAVNHEDDGFVDPSARPAVLARRGEPLGLDADAVDRLLHLDAERNALLSRVGPVPSPKDVIARYNGLLVLSVLRHASSLMLDLPGLAATTVETVCARHEVDARRMADGPWRLAGRKDATGSWARFGPKLARCALHLMLLAPRPPSGAATVHLGDQVLSYVIDPKCVAAVRPRGRAAAGPDGVLRSAILANEFAALRRRAGDPAHGWTARRATEPIVVEYAIVLPELIFVRGQTAIGLVPVAPGERDAAIATIERVNEVRPVIAFGVSTATAGVPALARADPSAVIALLDSLDAALHAQPSALDTLRADLMERGWVMLDRIDELRRETADRRPGISALTEDGDAAFVPGFGLCRVSVLEELCDQFLSGPVDVGGLRASVAGHVGDGPHTDALTLFLLSRQPLIAVPAGANLARAAVSKAA